MQIDKKPIGQNLVVQENVLLDACYRMERNEKCLLAIGMSKLDPLTLPKKIQKGDIQLTVTVDEWRQVFPDTAKPYRALKEAADKMLSRQWRMDDQSSGDKYIKGNWFDCCLYDGENQLVTLAFTYTTAVRLQGMKNNFTKYQLGKIGKLQSFNQIRLYEFFSRYRDTGWWTIGVAELKEKLDIQGSYPRWVDFRKSVIDSSIKIINRNTDLEVSYKTKKKKRRVVAIDFFINIDQQQELDL